MATLTVGAGKQFSRIEAAINAAASGDVIAIDAGTYKDFNSLTVSKNLTLQCATPGGMVVVTGGWVSNSKAFFVTEADVTFDHFEIYGAANGEWDPNGRANGAPIRMQKGNLVVQNCYLHDNQMGLFGTPLTEGQGTIKVINTEFSKNGLGDGYSHNMYIGEVALLTVDNCYFHDVNAGNEFKNRSVKSVTTNTRILGGVDNANWEMDFPNGGDHTVTNCVIQQSKNSQNKNMISCGVEGVNPHGNHKVNRLAVSGCILVNDMAGGGYLYAGADGVTATWADNKVWNAGGVLAMPAGMASTSTLSARPTLDTSQPWKAPSTPPIVTPPVVDPPPVVEPPPVVDPPPIIVAPPPPVTDPPPVSTTDPKFGVSIEVQANRILRIDVSEFGVKSAEYATRIARKTVSGGCEVTVDGKDSVLVKGYSAGELNTAKFIFAA